MTLSNITLYHYPLSRSMRVKFLLHELLGEDFTTVKIDLMRGEGFSESFREKNPNHAVPVIDIEYSDGATQTLIESIAILTFLADAYPEKALAPKIDDYIARANYLKWMAFGGAWMDMMLWQIRMHRDLLPKPMRHAATVELWSSKFTKEVTPQIRAALDTHDYIAGDSFTAADCMMAQNLNWARAYGLGIDPAIGKYMKRIKARPAFQLAMADAAGFEA